jgi:hypothetical protein
LQSHNANRNGSDEADAQKSGDRKHLPTQARGFMEVFCKTSDHCDVPLAGINQLIPASDDYAIAIGRFLITHSYALTHRPGIDRLS